MAAKFLSVEYRVYGRVQGVFFRKFTVKTSKKLGLVGWVKNESDGTVVGAVQGNPEKVQEMKEWLSKTGSPKSVIEKCDFTNEKRLSKLEFEDFEFRQ